jgi:galactokinase
VADLTPGSPTAAELPGYLLGAIWSLQQAGYPVGPVDLLLDSQVPCGAGLSSSDAVECATVLAVATPAGRTLDSLTIARITQRAENDFVGVPCGPMDQTASANCREGAVLPFDTRAGTTREHPVRPGRARPEHAGHRQPGRTLPGRRRVRQAPHLPRDRRADDSHHGADEPADDPGDEPERQLRHDEREHDGIHSRRPRRRRRVPRCPGCSARSVVTELNLPWAGG